MVEGLRSDGWSCRGLVAATSTDAKLGRPLPWLAKVGLLQSASHPSLRPLSHHPLPRRRRRVVSCRRRRRLRCYSCCCCQRTVPHSFGAVAAAAPSLSTPPFLCCHLGGPAKSVPSHSFRHRFGCFLSSLLCPLTLRHHRRATPSKPTVNDTYDLRLPRARGDIFDSPPSAGPLFILFDKGSIRSQLSARAFTRTVHDCKSPFATAETLPAKRTDESHVLL